MSRHCLLGYLFAFTLFVCIAGIGCTGRGSQGLNVNLQPGSLDADLVPPAAPPGPFGFLPAPDELAARLTSAGEVLLDGDQFETTSIVPANVAANGDSADFTPEWGTAVPPGTDDLAYALYAFDLTGYDEMVQLTFDWSAAPVAGELWFGLGNRHTQSWDWFSADPAEAFPTFAADTYRSTGNTLPIVILLTGAGTYTLDWLQIEKADVEAFGYAMPNQGWAPLTAYFSAFQTDNFDGTIASYEWDLDGDGVFETDATAEDGYTQHTYSGAGVFRPRLRVVDDAGHVATAQVEISVRDMDESSVEYDKVFDDSQVREVLLEVQQTDWDEMWIDQDAELEIPCDATIFGTLLPDVGLRFKGNGSKWGSGLKKPWKIDTNENVQGQEYENLKMLIFNNNFEDPSMLREKMAYDMLNFAGCSAGLTCFVKISIDIHGDGAPPIYWGVYTMVERVDKKFLANRFGQHYDGDNLYKADAWFEEGAADLAYYGEDIESYPKPRGEIAYGKETNGAENDYSDIIELCRVNDGVTYDTPEEYARALDKVLNVDSYLRYMACMVTCDNWDIYPMSGNNYYLYHNPVSDLFEWIPWDMNSTWSGRADRPLYVWDEPGPASGNVPLYANVFAVDRYKRAYGAYLDLLRRHWFTYDEVHADAQAWHDLLEPHVKQETGDKAFFGEDAIFPVSAFDTNWETEYLPDGGGPHRPGMTQLTQQRGEYIDDHLTADL